MKILFYCDEYPPAKTGGIGTATKIIAEELVARQHEVYIIGYYPENKLLPEYSLVNGVNVFRYNLKYRDTKLKQYIFKILSRINFAYSIVDEELKFTEDKIQFLIEKYNIDILELTDYYAFNVYPSRKRNFRKFSIPTILRIHGSVSYLQSLKGIRTKSKRSDELHFNRCDYISAVSKYAMAYMYNNYSIRSGIPPKIIYNPIENTFFSKSEFKSSNSVLFIGKITQSKGCFDLIEAFNRCAEKFPSMNLRLIGSGLIEEARKKVLPKYRNRVHFLGFCTRENIVMEIDNCAFACIPSYLETFGMVAVEVMARRKTLIFTDTSAGPEIVTEGVDGYTVSPGDIRSIVDKMCMLFSDIKLREHFANNAYTKCYSMFSATKIVDQIENYYMSLIGCKENSVLNKVE